MGDSVEPGRTLHLYLQSECKQGEPDNDRQAVLSDKPLETVFLHLTDGAYLRGFIAGADVAADFAAPDGVREGEAALLFRFLRSHLLSFLQRGTPLRD